MLKKSYASVYDHPVYGDQVLDQFGISEHQLLGAGRHSRVYAVDRVNVLRIYSPEISFQYVESLSNFYKTLDSSAVGFSVPEVEEFGIKGDYIFSIEKHLGQTMGFALQTSDQLFTDKHIDEYVKILDKIAHLKPELKDIYGEVIGDDIIQSESWGEYLYKRAEKNLDDSTIARLRTLIPNFDKIFEGWRVALTGLENPQKNLVHGDIFPGNLMVDDGGSISAVIDFSPNTVIGDKLLDIVPALIQIDYGNHFDDEQVAIIETEVKKIYKLDREIFNIYEMFIYLCYSSDPRELKRVWCHNNISRLIKEKAFI